MQSVYFFFFAAFFFVAFFFVAFFFAVAIFFSSMVSETA